MKRILLIEDEPTNQDLIRRYLALLRYEVIIAGDGARGVELARAERPDLILMDLSLPVMDGWSATRALKYDPATQPIPIIVLTANAMQEDADQAFAAGCDAFATKPIDFPSLKQTISELLERVV